MSVMNSPHDLRAHDDHLRHLLDQRAARADLHGRFPSLSEFSDSPSVYSHAHFSPRPIDRPQFDPNLRSFHSAAPPQHQPTSPRSPMSDRERLNFPNSSSLDLDDDPRSSNEYSISPEDEESPIDDEEEELPRVSMYGPKMRFHSRAPWELDNSIEEQNESESSGGTKRSRTNKADTGKKGWGLSKGINEKRPSTESSRSQARGKQSFDTVSSFSNNGGALFALAQASMSSTSLAAQSSPQHTLRDKLSLPRLRTRTPSNPKPASVELPECAPPIPPHSVNSSPMSRYPRPASPTDMSPVERTFSSHSSTRAPTPNTQSPEYAHPYANPDLARRGTPENSQQIKAIQQTSSGVPSRQLSPVGRSDSTVTLTETSGSSSMFQSQSNTTMSMSPHTSASSVNIVLDESPPSRSGGVHGKGISAPILMKKGSISSLATSSSGPQEAGNSLTRNRDTRLLSGMNSSAFPGWGEIPASPSIKLISLEQAQAQARERSRSATAHGAISSSSAPGAPKAQAQNAEFDQQSQARVRSTSAGGVKGKNAPGGVMVDMNQRLPPLPADSPQQVTIPAMHMGGGVPPTPRTVARKKSGFMRLFKDRDRLPPPPQNTTPPPMPQLATESYPTAFSSASIPQTFGSRKGSTHRVPVPSFSPSMVDAGQSVEYGSFSDSRSDISAAGATRERQLSARRNAPELSIVTSKPAGPSTSSDVYVQSHLTPTTGSAASLYGTHTPNSAPPGKTDFVALSLRPVSTLFSTNFADQLISPGSSVADSRPSLETDLDTPTTATTALTPLSPDFQLRTYPPGEDKASPDSYIREDQSAIIQALQEQIMTARRGWQRQIWELEGQVRDLKTEVEELRSADSESPYCAACGRGTIGRPCPLDSTCVEDLKRAGVKVGVVDRPRARTGIGSRFASGT